MFALSLCPAFIRQEKPEDVDEPAASSQPRVSPNGGTAGGGPPSSAGSKAASGAASAAADGDDGSDKGDQTPVSSGLMRRITSGNSSRRVSTSFGSGVNTARPGSASAFGPPSFGNGTAITICDGMDPKEAIAAVVNVLGEEVAPVLFVYLLQNYMASPVRR